MKRFRSALSGAGVALAVYFSGFFVLWTPLPFLYLSLTQPKWVWRISLTLTAVSLFCLYWFLVPVPSSRFLGLGYFFFYGVVALFLGVGVERHWKFAAWGWRGVLPITLIFLLAGFVSQTLGLFDLQGFFQTILGETSQTFDAMIRRPGYLGSRPEMVPYLLKMKGWLLFFPKLLPAFLFIFTLLVMILNVSLLRMLTWRKISFRWLGSFKHLQLFHHCLWLFLLAGFGFFADTYWFHSAWLKVLSLNLVFVMTFVYFLQGLSILAFFLRRFSPLFRFGIYGLLILFLQVLGLAVVGLGLADTWFDFRKLQRRAAWK